MKIFFPFSAGEIGGTSIFSRRFSAGMCARGHEVFHEYREDYDILFMIVQAPFRYLLDAKRRGKPIVQRLDGVYYWTVAGWKFPLYNLKATLSRHFFTTLTIYQSAYSRQCANLFLGKKYHDQSVLIYNGVDTANFTPTGPVAPLRENPDQVVFFSSSDFRRPDQIVPIIEALTIYRNRYGNNFKFYIAGEFRGKAAFVPKTYAQYQQLVFLGKIDNVALPAYERAADAYLISHLNPPCPNNVIEALACGLPVCGVDDGAMSELVEHGKSGLLVPAIGSAFWKARSLDAHAFAENMHLLAKHRSVYSPAARERALTLFQLDAMLSHYHDALISTL